MTATPLAVLSPLTSSTTRCWRCSGASSEIAFSELATITAPTLVVQGGHDDVRLEHTAAAVAAMPGARLAVLPGTHTLPLESPDVVNPLVVSFLAGDPPGAAFGPG